MSTTKEEQAICVRTTRLNNLILGNTDAKAKASKSLTSALSREALLDTLTVLYTECDKDGVKKRDHNVSDFVNKYRDVIAETDKLRVNINDFSMKDLIGKGYFGVVHLAAEKATGDIYAIKTIRKSPMTSSLQVKEERDIMASRSSEWITALQYAFQDHQNLYLVMEYLPGGDLLSLMIRNGAFDEDLSRFYLAEMTLALNALHTLGFVHRDIKPENILLDRFGHLKLADFGSATVRNKDGKVVTFSPVGTPEYVAPELLQALSTIKPSKSIHDVTCDYWSMGVIGYELITETTPFHNDNVNETYARILAHCDGSKVKNLKYAPELEVSLEFRDLIDHLVTTQKKRFTYNQIVLHPFFETIRWDSLRLQTPPIIPTLSGDDDTSNFEDVQKKSLRGTFTKPASSMSSSVGFSGENLPFIGYSFVHEDHQYGVALAEGSDHSYATKLKSNIKDLQKMVDEQLTDIKALQQNLLMQQRKGAQIDTMEKILNESKKELNSMKEKLKEKTVELATCKTQIKTLQSNLKIEEEMREKNDANISEVLNSTYQKWEKSKKLSDQNYEKQLSEKKIEISSLSHTLKAREQELTARVTECTDLREKCNNYRESMQKAKERSTAEKAGLEQQLQSTIDDYEGQVTELKLKLSGEKKDKRLLSDDLRQMRRDSQSNVHSMQGVNDGKVAAERNLKDVMERLNKEIDSNKTLREEKRGIDRQLAELQRRFDELQAATSSINSRRSSNGQNDVFHSLRGSFESLTSAMEQQLRNDLRQAEEGEIEQRKRADRLEGVVKRLEEAIERLGSQTSKPTEELLERQNEKLEDKLATVREQAIVDRQASRTAHLSAWKLEKQVDTLSADKNDLEAKLKRVQGEKDDADKLVKEQRLKARLREEKIVELQNDLANLKKELVKEHSQWEKAEHERINQKSETVMHISKIQNLEEKLAESGRKLRSTQQQKDELSLENKRLLQKSCEDEEELSNAKEMCGQSKSELAIVQNEYAKLKQACLIMDGQVEELQTLYANEAARNTDLTTKMEKLRNSIREREAEILKLRQEKAAVESVKAAAESKLSESEKEIGILNENLRRAEGELVKRQEELFEKTANLFEAQEVLEVNKTDIETLQRINENYERQTVILKEENAKVLTDFFMSREENNKLAHESKNLKNILNDQSKELEHLSGTLSEMKTYYLQRDLKSEATQSQYKKLIDHLQAHIDEQKAKKKKSLAEIIFGSSAKKENIPPSTPRVEDSEEVKKLQTDLKRQRTRSNTLKEQLLKTKTDLRMEQDKSMKCEFATPMGDKKTTDAGKKMDIMKSKVSDQSESNDDGQMHRFEMTLLSNPSEACAICNIPILGGNSFWKCQECKITVHRKCRGNAIPACGAAQNVPNSDAGDKDSVGFNVLDLGSLSNGNRNAYRGDIVFKNDKTTPPLNVHCVVEIHDSILLFGTSQGLLSYNMNTEKLVNIAGLDSVNSITINPAFPKCILVGSNGRHLYQCDVRHLQTRAQASASLRPTLNCVQLETPFDHQMANDRWHFIKIYSNQDHLPDLPDALAIVGNSSRFVIMRYDITNNCFKAIRSLDTATPIESVLFTKHTALIGSDKFFEIELSTFAAEEFLDLSDSSLSLNRYSKPKAAFKINSQEYLLCFERYGLFTDEYGCRSRINDIVWLHPPRGFVYRDPVLFVGSENAVQVIRITKSDSSQSAKDIGASDHQYTVIDLNGAQIVGEAGQLGAFVLSKQNGGYNDLVVIEGVKALKSILTNSMETLLSSLSSIPQSLQHGLSIDTLSSLDN